MSYTGTGYFVVDLDKLSPADVTQDRDQKTVTIQLGHAYLQAIKIDPDSIIIDEVEESLLARHAGSLSGALRARAGLYRAP